MAKAAIVKKFSLNANGILSITEDEIALENPDSGEMIPLGSLLEDFKDRIIKLSVTYDEDYV